MTIELTVDHEAGDRYRVDVRGHVLHCDQPPNDGGTDTAATPSELSLSITPPHGLTERDVQGLLAVASHCTVHNTLISPPEVTVRLASGAPRWSGQVRCIEC